MRTRLTTTLVAAAMSATLAGLGAPAVAGDYHHQHGKDDKVKGWCPGKGFELKHTYYYKDGRKHFIDKRTKEDKNRDKHVCVHKDHKDLIKDNTGPKTAFPY